MHKIIIIGGGGHTISCIDVIKSQKKFSFAGIKIVWKGKGVNSKCFDNEGNCIVECDKAYYRPLEVDTLLGNSNKARRELKWKPKTSIKMLVKEMVDFELKN